MGLREVKKELQELEKDELIYHISEIYKKYKPVKQYFDFFANPDEGELLEKFKERVYEGFYPAKGRRLKLYRSRKALNEFKKLGISPGAEAELLLYFTCVAVKYAREKKPGNESYYVRLENSFEKALEHLQKHLSLEEYRTAALNIVSRSSGLPWNCGIHIQTLFDRSYVGISRKQLS